ncbi:hypothetical protein [Pararhizobium haloflavum]|uniref:hypothetical protein n=1 Tax=Pararhizobium haloflavum TaxID=2037914 RepID=UPI000C176D98|nr:hypothetical protein [Pararhizobium haloflavum]
MRFHVVSAVRRAAVALVMVLALVAMPVGSSSAHDPWQAAMVEAERHKALEREIQEHGHVHDDGAWDEQYTGHLHGHNATDHAHDTPASPPPFVTVQMTRQALWAKPVPDDRPHARPYEIERPPRA